MPRSIFPRTILKNWELLIFIFHPGTSIFLHDRNLCKFYNRQGKRLGKISKILPAFGKNHQTKNRSFLFISDLEITLCIEEKGFGMLEKLQKIVFPSGSRRNYNEKNKEGALRMKIKEIKMIPAGKYLFLKVEADNGLSGIGEVGVWGYLDAGRAVLEKLKKHLLGQDAMNIEHLGQYLYRSLYFRGAVIMSAISALDIALWDLKGKYLEQPVYQLLGGRCRDRIRTYAPVFQYTAREMAEGCLRLKEQGFTAARLILPDLDAPVRQSRPTLFAQRVEEEIQKVRCCREAVGNDFDLCLEVHRSMSLPEAMAFAKGVEPFHPMFLEDPIPPDVPSAMAELAAHTTVPITTGERAINIQEMEHLLSIRAAQYLRPDVCTVGGITAGKKIAALAEAHYAAIIPHNPLGPVSTAACLQLDACIPNCAIQEFPSFNVHGGEDSMVKEPLQVEAGHLLIPDRPGIGIELAEDLEERFPPAPRDLTAVIGYDGSVVDR